MYRKSSHEWLKHLDFILLDILCLHIAFVTAYMLRNGAANPYRNQAYCSIAIVLTLIDITILISFGSLQNVLKRGYYQECSITFQHVCLVELVMGLYLFATHTSTVYSRITLFLTGGLYFLITYIARVLYKQYLKEKLFSETEGSRSMFVVTDQGKVSEVMENLLKYNYGKFHIAGIGILDWDRNDNTVNGVPVVADATGMADYVCREWIDEVFICLDSRDLYLEQLIRQFSKMGIVVHIALDKPFNMIEQKQLVEKIGNYITLTNSINYASLKQLFFKRSLDVIGGLVGCLITGILAVILGPFIYVQSPGPIFFSQIRVGKNGRKFKMYKFRSMYLDAEERKKELEEQNKIKDGMMFKLEYDPRIIGCSKKADGTIKKGVGNYIRDWSLDEFPQFFNVLKGDMSLVGTRPPTVDEWEKYELHHRARLAIKPGLTGMWQVSGRSNITDFEEVVKLDTQYINEWSLGLDVKILMKTVAVVLHRDGAM